MEIGSNNQLKFKAAIDHINLACNKLMITKGLMILKAWSKNTPNSDSIFKKDKNKINTISIIFLISLR